MKTRRGFLQAGSLALAAQLSDLSIKGQAATQNNERASEAIVVRDYWNDFPNYLTSSINQARARRKSDLSKITTPKAALERASFIRSNVWDLIGGPLEKTPLNVISTGTIERGAYKIEKLIFESQPQFYVPAHLYIPKAGTGPFPGIIAPLGHTDEGKSFRSYQILFQNLARQGFVVLTWDPPSQGERIQYLVHGTNRSKYGPTGEHDQFGWPALLLGSSTTQFEVCDGIRALDYLLSRKEVDSTRIGCCGHSGGGTQTMYLCALEPRIHAAVVVEGHTENLAGANYEPPGAYADAEQNIIGGLKLGIDRGDLLASFAPNPLLICFTHMDVGATYSPHYEHGTREIYQELKDVYSLHHASEKVGLSASNLPHDYDFFHRRATYEWFNKWLKEGQGTSTEADFDESPDSELNCTSTGQIVTSLGGRTAVRVNADRLRTIQSSRNSGGQQNEKLRQTLREVLALPSSTSATRATVLSSNTSRGILIEEFELHSEPAIRVPGWFLKPSAATAKLPVAVLLLNAGKNRLFDDLNLLGEITSQNVAVCAIDTRAMGQATPRLPNSGPLFYSHAERMAYALVSLAAGSPLIGQRVWDVLCCLNYVAARPDVDQSRIGLFGNGASGLEALFSAALDNRVKAVLLERTLTDFASLVKADDYNLGVDSVAFGFLKHFDLPEISSAIAPRPLWLSNPVDPAGVGLALSNSADRYVNTKKTYAALQRADQFQIKIQDSDQVFKNWLQAALM
jgi:cephalosporin-C deacetylase-like acetyl esterase